MPKVLFTDEYKDLSAEAKLLYGLMLDRMQLSAINGWCDKNGEVFIFYTIAETSEVLGCGHDKATRLQRELEKHTICSVVNIKENFKFQYEDFFNAKFLVKEVKKCFSKCKNNFSNFKN